MADVGFGILLMYCAFWLYEIGNLSSLLIVGEPAGLVFQGGLPVATVSDVPSYLSIFAKPIQLGVSLGVMLLLLRLMRDRELPILKATICLMIGCYVSSISWEMLSLSAFALGPVHEELFGLTAATVTSGLVFHMRHSILML